MKNKRNIISVIIFYTILTSFSLSQSVMNNRIINIENGKEKLFFNKTQIANDISFENLVIEGSPFNNNDNPQIDSVIIEKIISLNNEIIKYYYNYDSLGNVAIETKTNYWKLINAYDSVGNKINFFWEIWENNQWDNFALIT
ncbi:MAG: hypothetical protein KKD86_07775, partial [Bacteroidetes bacterium]|nr:hypothetical protein [Bacteroidota bacterium]